MHDVSNSETSMTFNGKSDENEMAAIQISSAILPRILAEMTPISLLS